MIWPFGHFIVSLVNWSRHTWREPGRQVAQVSRISAADDLQARADPFRQAQIPNDQVKSSFINHHSSMI